MILSLILLIVIVCLLILLSMVWPPDSPWSPWWKTHNKVAVEACKLANITAKDTIIELGCGDAEFLLTAAKITGAKGIGIEIDPLRYVISRMRVYFWGLRKKIIIKRNNFYRVPTESATVVFLYLIPRVLNKLKPKLMKELRPGTRILSYRYTFDMPLVAEDKKNKMYLYIVPESKKKKL